MEAAAHSKLGDAAAKVLTASEELLAVGQRQPALLEAGARDFALSLSNLFIAAVFLQNAALAGGGGGGGGERTSSDTHPYRHAELLALR